MSRVARIPPELIHHIVARLVPSWDWGSNDGAWKEIRKLKPARAHAFWFLNLRLVNRIFNTVVLDLFADVVVNGFPIPHALTDGPETDSMMTMGRRILQHLVSSFAGNHLSGKTITRAKWKSPFRLVNMIIHIGERAAALLSDPRLENDEDLREAYTEGAIATLTGLSCQGRRHKDSTDDFGKNPFMNAAVGGADEIIDIFFQRSLPSGEVWRRDKRNETALQLAVQNDRDNVVKRLLGPDIGATEEIIQDALRDAEARFACWIEDQESTRDSPEWEDWCLEQRRKEDINKTLSDALELGL